MESYQEENLEVDIGTIIKIVDTCIKVADWAFKHKDEIIRLVKAGWRSAQAIVNYLRNKYGH